jgi:nitric oxide reductase NorQ protein
MTHTMVVVSVQGSSSPDHRYDFIATAKPRGITYYRLETADYRSRWKRSSFDLINFPLDLSGDLLAGPALMEVTDQEANEIENGTTMHPPRNVGLRAERIKKSWAGPELVAGALDPWLEDWRQAVRDSDELWITTHTHRNGRIRPSRAQLPNAVSLTATSTSTSAISATAAPPAPAHNLFTYPEVVKGSVLRPNGESYRVRKIGRKTDVHVFREMREHRVHSLTFGQPGTGKTAMFEAAFGSQMITMMGTEDTESADFQGSYVENDAGLWVWEDGPLVIAMENGWVLYIDEIGVIRQKQMSQLYSVMDGRDEIRITANPKRGVVKAAPGFAIVASTNPDSPEVRLTDALLNRMGFKLEVNSDFKMAREHFYIPVWLVNAAENLELRRKSKELPWAPQMRDLLLWMENVTILGGEAEATGVMINSAPAASRAVVADVLSKGFGRKVGALVLA